MQVLPEARVRTWLVDHQRPHRHMTAKMHRDHGIVLLGLWEDNVCVNTFRLRVQDAPLLIHALVDSLAIAIDESPSPAPQPPAWQALAERLHGRWLQHHNDARRLLDRALHRSPPHEPHNTSPRAADSQP